MKEQQYDRTLFQNPSKKTKRKELLDTGCGLGGIAADLSHVYPDIVIDIMDGNSRNFQELPGIKIRKVYEGGAENIRQVVGRTKYDMIIVPGVSLSSNEA